MKFLENNPANWALINYEPKIRKRLKANNLMPNS
jgi:hypothetical protein